MTTLVNIICWNPSGIFLYEQLIFWGTIVPANESRRYVTTPFLIGWAHTQEDPWIIILVLVYNKYDGESV